MNGMQEKINMFQSDQLGIVNTPNNSRFESENLKQMRQALRNFESVAERFLGTSLANPNPQSWMKFASLSQDHQLGAIRGIESQAAFIQAAMEEGLDAFDELGMLDYAKRTFSLLGDSQYSNQIQKGDIVEIVDSDFIQIYRSYSCFSLCNYSLLELSSYPWWELYDRPSRVTEDLIAKSREIFEGRARILQFESEVAPYTIRELMTTEQEMYQVQERFAAKMLSAATGKTVMLSVKRITPVPAASNSQLGFI
jgi:hypothetical protein